RAAPAGDRRRRPHALLQTPRAGRDPPPGAHRERRAGDPRGGDGLMAEIVMPRPSDSMEEGTTLSWLQQVWGQAAFGDELGEIETEKANMAYEADVAGTLTEILAQEGETLPIGAPIAMVGDASEGGSKDGKGLAPQAAGPVTAGDPPLPP